MHNKNNSCLVYLALTIFLYLSACSNSRSSSSTSGAATTADAASITDSGTTSTVPTSGSCTPSLCTASSTGANCAFYSCNMIDVVTDDGLPLGTCKEWVGANTVPPAGAPPQMLDAIRNGCESDGGIFSSGPCPCDDLVASCHVLSGGPDSEYVDRFYANLGNAGSNLGSALQTFKSLCNAPSEWIE
jgi:hypothetical protein